jgi:acyl-CoA synthetase (AMP-forming)/AMP-acid ligase II
VAITHENLIASILQASAFLETTREAGSEVALGFLPFNHIYGLWTAHVLMYLGDSVIIHRGFNFMEIMASIVKYRINTLYLVSVFKESLLRFLVRLTWKPGMQADGCRCLQLSTRCRGMDLH